MVSVILVENVDRNIECIITQLKEQKDFRLVEIGCDGYDALKLSNKHKPNIIIINLSLNFYNEVEISHLLKENSPGTSVVLISSHAEIQMIKKTVRSRISAYLLTEDIDNLVEILRRVIENGIYVNPKIEILVFSMLADLLHEKRPNNFRQNDILMYSRKELKIIELIGLGKSDKEISDYMQLKNGTIRNYISGLLKKTGLKNRLQLVRYAMSNGFTNSSMKRIPERE